jgi:hypothetical protein
MYRHLAAAAALLIAVSGNAFAQAQVGPVQSGGGLYVIPSGASAASITPVVSTGAEASHVLKASGGNLYSVYATNLTTTPGFLIILNATSAPADGAVTPLDCIPLKPLATAVISYAPGPLAAYSTGITAVATSASTCFTKTTGVITAFFKGAVQ